LYVPVPNFSAVYAFTVNSGVLAPVAGSPFNVASGVSTLATDPAGKFLFAPNPTTNTVTVFTLSTGALSAGPGAFGTGTTPVAAITDSTGAYLYLANFGSSNVSQFKIDSTTGALTVFTTSTVSAGTHPLFEALDLTGKFLFVGNQGSSSISEFSFNTDGSLASNGNSIQLSVPPRSIAFTK